MNAFRENGYLFAPGLIDTTAYYAFFGRLVESGRGKANKLVPGSVDFYKEPLCEKLLEHLLPAIESLTGHKLYKTYSYARRYNFGSELVPHIDREACEITATLALGYEGTPWPIWVQDRQGQPHSFQLHPGDALIFRGSELPHWREINTYGPASQVFLHYVDRNGPHAYCRDDLDELQTD